MMTCAFIFMEVEGINLRINHRKVQRFQGERLNEIYKGSPDITLTLREMVLQHFHL